MSYENQGVHLAGTLTLPRGQGPFPAAVMITGAGTEVSFAQAVDSHLFQAELMMREAGANEEAITLNNAIQKMIFRVLRSESDSRVAVEKMRTELDRMIASLPEVQRKALETPAVAASMNQQFASATLPEMRSIFLHDSGATLRQLKVPVLALNGSRDVQVSARLNLPAIAAALAESGNSDFTVVELPGLNHLFQTCTKCTVAEYGDLDQTFSPAALLIMGDWLVLHTRGQSDR